MDPSSMGSAAPPARGARGISSLSSQLAAVPPRDSAASDRAGGGRGVEKTASDAPSKRDKPIPSNVSTADASQASTALSAPFTPRRLSFPSRLSVQTSTRGPLSPVLDPALGYSVARRPRLDFARACTSLHHSTLAESSPDSSPLAPSYYPIPRNNSSSKTLDSPIATHNHAASSHASSLGSASMMDYAASGDDLNSSSDDDSIDLDIDLIPSADQSASAASLSLRDHQKARLGARSNRKHSSASSNSGNSTVNTPPPTTPPISQTPFFAGFRLDAPRRDILDSEVRPDPIRRPVSRRGSLLPKTKNFQRIKAALFEEASPVEVEVKREAEITRQIREEEEDPSPPPMEMRHQPSVESELSDIHEEDSMRSSSDSASQGGGVKGMGISFTKQAQRHGGFWFGDQMEGISGSPPTFPGLRSGSDGDIVMNSDSVANSPVATVRPEIRRAKRRRTEDERFEPAFLKRRAVSPGLSHSPILASSPQSAGNGGGKRLNFQGMSDTSDGLMKMSLQ